MYHEPELPPAAGGAASAGDDVRPHEGLGHVERRQHGCQRCCIVKPEHHDQRTEGVSNLGDQKARPGDVPQGPEKMVGE